MKWTYVLLAILVIFGGLLLVSCTPEQSIIPLGPSTEKQTQENETEPQQPSQPSKTEFQINCKVQEGDLCAAQAQTLKGWTLGTVPLSIAEQLLEEGSSIADSKDLSAEQISEFSQTIASYVYNSSRKILSLAEEEYDEEYNVVKVVPQYLDEQWVWQVSFFQEDLEEPDEEIIVDFQGEEIFD